MFILEVRVFLPNDKKEGHAQHHVKKELPKKAILPRTNLSEEQKRDLYSSALSKNVSAKIQELRPPSKTPEKKDPLLQLQNKEEAISTSIAGFIKNFTPDWFKKIFN
jgi:hypothetical protein